MRLQQAGAGARHAGVQGRVSFRRQDLFATPIREANVIALYLLPSINLQLRPRLLTEDDKHYRAYVAGFALQRKNQKAIRPPRQRDLFGG